MLSSSALKYKINITPSNCAGVVIFLLYLFVLVLSLFVVSINLLSLLFYLVLLTIALLAAKKASAWESVLLLSESGEVESLVKEKYYQGSLGKHSFYNGLFIFLQLDIRNNPLEEKSTKQFITIYHDAITEEQYRLLARLINNGRH